MSQFVTEVNDPEAIVELEIRLSASEPLGQYQNEPYFFELSLETFLTEKRTVLPSELFFFNAVDDTLTLSTTVVQAEPYGLTSTISQNGEWLEMGCEADTSVGVTQVQHLIPFVLDEIRIQVRDAQGNQRLLGDGDSGLELRIYKGESA